MARLVRESRPGFHYNGREVLFARVPGGNPSGITSKGEFKKEVRVSDKRQQGSNAASKSIGQSPKDETLEMLDGVKPLGGGSVKCVRVQGRNPMRHVKFLERTEQTIQRRVSTGYWLRRKGGRVFQSEECKLVVRAK